MPLSIECNDVLRLLSFQSTARSKSVLGISPLSGDPVHMKAQDFIPLKVVNSQGMQESCTAYSKAVSKESYSTVLTMVDKSGCQISSGAMQDAMQGQKFVHDR